MDNKQSAIDHLVNKLTEENLSVFIGAGLSTGAGLPNWNQLIEPLAKELGMDITQQNDLTKVAQYFVNEHAADRSFLNDHLTENLTTQHKSTDAHKILSELPLKIYWTTNYDRIIENTLAKAKKPYKSLFEASQLSIANIGVDTLVIKIHGDIEHPESITITQEDYENYESSHGALQSLLLTELISSTFLFLGFSFSDPNIQYLIARLKQLLSNNKRPHYWLEIKVGPLKGESEKEYLSRKATQKHHINDLKRYGIKCILCDSPEDVTKFLSDLKTSYRVVSSSLNKNSYLDAKSDNVGANKVIVRAPAEGIFFASEGRGEQPLISVGEYVRKGQNICLLQVRNKLVYIRSLDSGHIAEISLNEGASVKSGQQLFLIDADAKIDDEKLHFEKAPVNGVFYRAKDPQHPPFVREGHKVRAGDVIALVEEAKMYFEIVASFDGIIVKIIPDNKTEVKKGNSVIIIRPFTKSSSTGEQWWPVMANFSGTLVSVNDNGIDLWRRPELVNESDVIAFVTNKCGKLQVLSGNSGVFGGYFKSNGDTIKSGDVIGKIIKTTNQSAYAVQLSKFSGIFEPLVNDNEYVSKGEVIAYVYGSGNQLEEHAAHSGRISLKVDSGQHVHENMLLFHFYAK